jgi:hypothetical protein
MLLLLLCRLRRHCSAHLHLLLRFSQDPAVWACLAALAMAAGELPTAEAAYAAIDAVDKLQFVLHLRGKTAAAAGGGAAGGDVAVAAELALYRRQPDEAEAMLLQVCCAEVERHGRQSSVSVALHWVPGAAAGDVTACT